MNSRIRLRFPTVAALAVCATLAVAVSLSGSAAFASPATASSPAKPANAVKVAMHIVGFDASVAAANGYTIKTDANGKQRSIKNDASTNAVESNVVTPDNQIDGNCGSSWIYYNAIGNSSASISTGFALFFPATSYWWFVRINDAGGQNNHVWAGGLANLFGWSVYQQVGGLSHGLSVATVSVQSSAVLANGGVCKSGGPTDLDNVY
jgi:hypothetical protein